MADTDTPVLDLLGKMNADAIEASSLDVEALMLTRIAALVAVDAPPASYLLNLGAASEIGIDAKQIRGVLTAIAPIEGTPPDRLGHRKHRPRARNGTRARRARGRDQRLFGLVPFRDAGASKAARARRVAAPSLLTPQHEGAGRIRTGETVRRARHLDGKGTSTCSRSGSGSRTAKGPPEEPRSAMRIEMLTVRRPA